MPPKLRKDKPPTGPKLTPTGSNRFDALSNHQQKYVTETQIATMQDNINSMTPIIQVISESIHKMEKLDKINQSRQKSTQEHLHNIVNKLCHDFNQLNINGTIPPYTEIPATSFKNQEYYKKQRFGNF